MNLIVSRRGMALFCVAIVALVGLAAAALLMRPVAEPAAVDGQAPQEDFGKVPQPTSTPITPEEQAKADLERLVREYEAVENAIFLDPTRDPSAELDPYLRNPASGARIADILSFRNEGHVFDTRTAEVHGVNVTELGFGDSHSASLEECSTLTGVGMDGQTGQVASFSNRRLTIWTAQTLPDGTWRLFNYDSGEPGSC